MTRRTFLQASALPALQIHAQPPTASNTWLFFDLWHLDGMQGAKHRQGRAEWVREASYEDPLLDGHSSWPTVYRHEDRWRMLYSAAFQPFRLLMAESTDGIHWKPAGPRPIYEIPGSAGLYINPVAADGYRFKLYGRLHGEPAVAKALADPTHEFHSHAKEVASGRKDIYIIHHFTARSKDALTWTEDHHANWAHPGWHPEPPLYCYYNPNRKQHFMTTRPGHGERRTVIQSSPDALHWSGPELLLQPDPLDGHTTQFYGMPVFAYEGHYIGFLWNFHVAAWDSPARYNHMVGLMDSQLAYSFDGVRFQRSFREPFVARNAPGEPGSGLVQPSCLIDAGDTLRIYTTAGKPLHGTSRQYRTNRAGQYHILLHTLRRDGFHYLESEGSWAGFYSKPLLLNGLDIEINASALRGEVRFQITDVDWKPIPGFTFDEAIPLRDADAIRHKLRWKNPVPESIANKPVRLEARFLNARIYAVRGPLHWLDAQEMHQLDDGRPIQPRPVSR